MSGLVPFIRVADAEETATWYARLGFREDGVRGIAVTDLDGNRLRVGTPVAG